MSRALAVAAAALLSAVTVDAQTAKVAPDAVEPARVECPFGQTTEAP